MNTQKSQDLLNILDHAIETLNGNKRLTAHNKTQLLTDLISVREAIKQEPDEENRWKIFAGALAIIFKLGKLFHEYWEGHKQIDGK